MTSRQWRNQCPALVTSQQRLAMIKHLLLVRQNGPTAFSLSENEGKVYQVYLGDPHRCSCKFFRRNKDLCLHICWVLLKKLQLTFQDPLSYQVGMMPHEISDCLQPRHQNLPKQNFSNYQRNKFLENLSAVPKRQIKHGDTCPVCLDEFSGDLTLMLHCKYGCGKAVHVRCMNVVAKYQMENSTDIDFHLSCPLCRGDFGTMKELMAAKRNISKKKNLKVILPCHKGYSCCSCDITPVMGPLYRCLICTQVTYCSSCATSNTSAMYHDVHGLAIKEKPEDRWKPISRVPRLNTSNCTKLPPLLKAVPHLDVKKVDT